MSRDDGRTYFIGNPGSGIATDFPKAVRTYDAGILSFSKIFSDSWLAQASYTLSYLRGNWEGLFRSQNFQLDPGITSEFDLPSLLVNRKGPLAGDRRHEVKVYLARDIELSPMHHITIGGSYRARSGGPTNYLGAHIDYGTGEAFLLPRGSGDRLPWEHTIDLHVGYTFYETKDATISVTADIFNLFNLAAIIRTDQDYTTRPVLPITGANAANPFVNGDRKVLDPTKITAADGEPRPFQMVDKNRAFGAPLEYQAPVTMRFGVKGTF
jgi:hypothetical protein